MNKTILSRLDFLFFLFPGIHLDAQSPKLNNAFYYSSGIVVDSKGNAFVTGKNNKIIKITPEGKASLFAGRGRNNKDGKGKDAGCAYRVRLYLGAMAGHSRGLQGKVCMAA